MTRKARLLSPRRSPPNTGTSRPPDSQRLADGGSGLPVGFHAPGKGMRGIVNALHELTERGVTVRSLHDSWPRV